MGNTTMVEKMVDRSINSLAAKCQRGGDQSRILVKNKLSMPEKSGAVLTCQVIIKFVIGHGIEEEDRKHSWLKDVNNFTSQVKKQTKTKQFYYYLARPKFIFLLSRLIGCI
jgi:pre-mRNA-processing factor 6